MYIAFLIFAVIMEIGSPSTITIAGEPAEYTFWIAIACRFVISSAVYGVIQLISEIYKSVVFSIEIWREYKELKKKDIYQNGTNNVQRTEE